MLCRVPWMTASVSLLLAASAIAQQGETTFFTVRGTLAEVQGQKILFTPDGESVPLTLFLIRESIVRLYAPISLEYFEPGCVGRVTGTYDVDRKVITNAQFEVYLANYDRRVALGQAREPHYNVHFITRDPKRIRVEFYGMLTSMPPDLWKVQGINRAHVSRYVVVENGESTEDLPIREFATFGYEFFLEPEIIEIDQERYLHARLPANWRIDPALKPRGEVQYYEKSKAIRTIYLRFAEPIEPKDLGVKRKKKTTRPSKKSR